MTDPRQPVLDHLATLRRERWKMAAWFGGMFVFALLISVLCAMWAAEAPEREFRRYVLVFCSLFNAWTAAAVIVRLRHHWQAILFMERATRAQLAWLALIKQDPDDPSK